MNNPARPFSQYAALASAAPGIDPSALAQAVGEHLAWRVQQGQGLVPAALDALQTPMLRQLRALEAGPEEISHRQRVGEQIVNSPPWAFWVRQAQESPAAVSEFWAMCTTALEQGDGFLSDVETCSATGARVRVRLQNWQVQACAPVWAGERLTWVPLDPAAMSPPTTHVVALPVPSGEVWVCDFIYLSAFQDLARALEQEELPGLLESVAGRATRTRRYAERLGVGHVFGRGPEIQVSEGLIKAGFADPNQPRDVARIGEVSGDLRWTTLVDRAHLVRLLEPALGQSGAEAAVAAYAAEHPELLRIQVQPGIHTLYFAGQPEVFAQTVGQVAAVEGAYLETVETPMFLLAREPLPAPAPPRSAIPRR